MAAKKLYGKGPRIDAAPAKGDVNKSANEQGAKAETAKTAGGDSVEGDMKSGGDAKADVMAGTDGIPTHHTHIAERLEVHNRHMMEHKDWMHRVERDHLARTLGHGGEDHATMNGRHSIDRRSMHTRHEQEMRQLGSRHALAASSDIKDKSVGTSGTQK